MLSVPTTAFLRLRWLIGVLVRDLPLYLRKLAAPGGDWCAIHNRDERLEPAPDGSGYRCLWQWTSELHAPRYVPTLGRWLMRRALADQPIARALAPQISFLTGHWGRARLPHPPAMRANALTCAREYHPCWRALGAIARRTGQVAGRGTSGMNHFAGSRGIARAAPARSSTVFPTKSAPLVQLPPELPKSRSHQSVISLFLLLSGERKYRVMAFHRMSHLSIRQMGLAQVPMRLGGSL